MSCHQQHGTRAYIDLIEAATGERITQADWHQLRIAAAETTGRSLTRSRADVDAKAEAMKMLDEAILIEADVDFERLTVIHVARVSPEQMLDGVTVTSGTVAVVEYLARNGVRRSLAKARQASAPNGAPVLPLERFAVNDSYPFPQANSIPKIASTVDAIEAGADTDEALAMSLGVSDRQGAYYGTALGYLGLAQETGDTPRAWQLTPAGAAFLNGTPDERVAILSHLYEQVGQKAMTTADGDSLSDATEDRRDAALNSCQSYLDKATAAQGVALERDETRGRCDVAAEHAREQKRRAREAVPTVRYGATCPTCFMAMPLSGVCDNCG